jgi:hypothetical protein
MVTTAPRAALLQNAAAEVNAAAAIRKSVSIPVVVRTFRSAVSGRPEGLHYVHTLSPVRSRDGTIEPESADANAAVACARGRARSSEMNAPVVTSDAYATDAHATMASPTHRSIHFGDDVAGPSIDFPHQLPRARRLRSSRRRGSANSRAQRHHRDELTKHEDLPRGGTSSFVPMSLSGPCRGGASQQSPVGRHGSSL